MRPPVHAQLIVVDAVLMESADLNSEKPRLTVSKIVLAHSSLKSEKEKAMSSLLNNVQLLSLDPTVTQKL